MLQLFNIRETRNFTCVAASKLGVIETQTVVKVQGELNVPSIGVEGLIRIFQKSLFGQNK